MQSTLRLKTGLLSLLLCLSFIGPLVNARDLKIGMSIVLTGPFGPIGHDILAGVDAYFQENKKQGGVNGSTLEIIALDDGYEPQNTARNMRHLIDVHNVVAVVGNTGTPTGVVSASIAREKKILLFAPVSGAEILRKAEYQPYIFNFRASYRDEINLMVAGLLSCGIMPEEIAFFTPLDTYGEAAYESGVKALSDSGFKYGDQLTHARFVQNTLNVHNAVATLLDAEIEPKAVLMAGSYASSAKFIQDIRQDLPDLLYYNLSIVGSKAFADKLGSAAENVVITKVVPHYDSTLPVAQEYRASLKEFYPGKELSFAGFEGYIVGKLFVEGLSRIEGPITRQALIDIFQKTEETDIGLNVKLRFHKGNNRSEKKVWPVTIRDQQFLPDELGENHCPEKVLEGG